MSDNVHTLLIIENKDERSFHEGNLDDLLRAFIPEHVEPLLKDRDLICDIEDTRFWFRRLNAPITPSFQKDLERFVQYGGLIRGMYFHTKPIPLKERRKFMNLMDLDYLNEAIEHRAITKSEAVIDLFESYLCSIQATIPNEERDAAKIDDPYETYNLIFGSHYDRLKDALEQII